MVGQCIQPWTGPPDVVWLGIHVRMSRIVDEHCAQECWWRWRVRWVDIVGRVHGCRAFGWWLLIGLRPMVGSLFAGRSAMSRLLESKARESLDCASQCDKGKKGGEGVS